MCVSFRTPSYWHNEACVTATKSEQGRPKMCDCFRSHSHWYREACVNFTKIMACTHTRIGVLIWARRHQRSVARKKGEAIKGGSTKGGSCIRKKHKRRKCKGMTHTRSKHKGRDTDDIWTRVGQQQRTPTEQPLLRANMYWRKDACGDVAGEQDIHLHILFGQVDSVCLRRDDQGLKCTSGSQAAFLPPNFAIKPFDQRRPGRQRASPKVTIELLWLRSGRWNWYRALMITVRMVKVTFTEARDAAVLSWQQSGWSMLDCRDSNQDDHC